MKYNLQDFTFLIPIRLDSIERLENITCTTRLILKDFVTNIMVLEASKGTNDFLKRMLPKNVTYKWILDDDPVFYRTHYLNKMTLGASTKFICIWDADVVLNKQQIIKSASLLRENRADMVYPYSGVFLNIPDPIREEFIRHPNIQLLERNYKKMPDLYNSKNLKGGAIMVNKEKYMECGLENEGFYGWGPEDFERYDRWKAFNCRIERVDGRPYHLEHPRDLNGHFNSTNQMEMANALLERIRLSTDNEIRNNISARSGILHSWNEIIKRL